jgi:Calx-beta domain/Metallo-peptidase family M12B Reprolysin-like
MKRPLPPLLLIALSLSLACLFHLAPGSAQTPRDTSRLFEPLDTGGANLPAQGRTPASPAAVLEQEIRINFDRLDFAAARELSLPLPDGKTYTAVRADSEGFAQSRDGGLVWRGKILDAAGRGGDVTLSVEGRALSGLIYSPEGVYEIIPQENFTHLLVQLDQTRFHACGGTLHERPAAEVSEVEAAALAPAKTQTAPNAKGSSTKTNGAGSSGASANASGDSAVALSSADDGTLLDVLVLYTSNVRAALGGTTQAQAFAQQAINSTNTAYINSGINPRARLAGAIEVSFTEAGDTSVALEWAANDPSVAAARNSFRADAVALIIENASDACGRAFVMNRVGAGFAGSAFSVTARGCAVGNLSFAHELGHNEGCQHDPATGDSPSNASFPYAFGHFVDGAFRTVMSYDTQCSLGCTRVPFFSNPSVNFNGQPTGVADQRDNHRVINNTALVFSQFRDSGGAPAGPPNDNFDAAQTVGGTNGTIAGGNVGATKEAGEPDHAGNTGGASVWYTWQSPANGVLTLTTAGSDFDTILAVYTGSGLASLTRVAANDDFDGLTSRVVFDATAGTTYRVAVDGFRNTPGGGAATGNVRLNWNLSVAAPPNDNFANAQTITGAAGAATGTNMAATKEPGEPNHAGNLGGSSIWYNWQAPSDGDVTLTTAGSDFDTLLAVYTGASLNTLNTTASNDDDPLLSTTTSRVSFNAVAGTVYRVAVDGFSNARGNVVLNWNLAPPSSSIQLGATGYNVGEGDGKVMISVTRTGNASAPASVEYVTVEISADRRKDYTQTLGALNFAPGETSKTVAVYITDDAFQEPPELFNFAIGNASGATLGSPTTATVVINDNDNATGPNPVAPSTFDAAFYVRQHYVDFLGREPDASGLAFWTNEITQCGANAQCAEVKRVNVSAAFFLSIEFQNTGYFAYRIYKAAYGDDTSPGVSGTVPHIGMNEFLSDTRRIGQGVVVGQGDWQQQLEANKQAYALEFVARRQFLQTSTPAQFVDQLRLNTGASLSQTERDALVSQLTANNTTAGRAAVLRAVAEDADLQQSEKSRAFVLMQYFGYLRRNPYDSPEPTLNYAGWKFWLDKLNQFGGDFVRAEMVKAFITSDEYRKRFGP